MGKTAADYPISFGYKANVLYIHAMIYTWKFLGKSRVVMGFTLSQIREVLKVNGGRLGAGKTERNI